jgi:dTDP-glucose pyrophosphorylase/predicted transcriptional regulator
MRNFNCEQVFINEEALITAALKKLDETGKKVLLVVDSEKKLIGVINDGDIRRYILKGKGLDGNIRELYNKKPISILNDHFSLNSARELMAKHEIEILPVIDNKGQVLDVVSWAEIISSQISEIKSPAIKLGIPVVIMAGGKGTRLDPFTKILPKPLIPIGDNPVIEIIIQRFREQGIDDFFLTLNHKAEMVEAYFNYIDRNYSVSFIREEKFLGTAGSLALVKDKLNGTFIVSNCDVMINTDFGDVYKFHKDNSAAMTVLSSIQHHKIPYGVIDFKEKGMVTGIHEKPEYVFTINTGVYLLERNILDLIPVNEPFDMTDLVTLLIAKGHKVLTYPVRGSDYIDVGQWEEYVKALEKLPFSHGGS